jgi:hypothetical protein
LLQMIIILASGMKGHMVVSQKIHGRDLNSDINNSIILLARVRNTANYGST